MISYGLNLWVQTLLALVALGLAGGWLLWLFRSADRPFLWLAAPLAGLPTLGLALIILYYGVGLHLVPSLVLGWSGLAGATLMCLRRAISAPGTPRFAAVEHPRTALLVLLLGSLWGAYVCNHESMRAEQPTLSIYNGSDHFGYSMGADWMRDHSGRERPQGSRLLEALPYVTLHVEGDRHTTFLLLASAGAVRGTTSAFSYDWLGGVVISAALLGMAGLFSSGPAGLWLLLAAGMTSAWLPVARTGYLGKAVAYPSCLLSCFLFLNAWARPTRSRIAAACVVSVGVAFTINPILPLLVVGMLLGGLLAALLLHRLLVSSVIHGLGDAPINGRSFVRAMALYLAMVMPAYVFHRIFFEFWMPEYKLPWRWTIASALDLENPSIELTAPEFVWALVIGMLIVTGLLLLTAFQKRNVLAQSFLLAIGLIPLAVLMGKTQVYGFHGVLYPMIAIGAALLLDPSWRPSRSAWLTGISAFTLLALHFPTTYQSGKRYLTPTDAQFPVVFTQSEVAKLRELIGNHSLDLCLGDVSDACLAITELGRAATPIRLHSPCWERTLKTWAGPYGYVVETTPPKGRFQLVEGMAYAPPDTVRYRSDRFQLLEDGAAVTFRATRTPQTMVWDEYRRPGFWQGRAPTEIELSNGTGTTAHVSFVAEGRPGSAFAASIPRKIRYQFKDHVGEAVLQPGHWQLELPLAVPPGIHLLSLSVLEPLPPLPKSGELECIVWFTNLRLKPVLPEISKR
jgi:hypothetical protein